VALPPERRSLFDKWRKKKMRALALLFVLSLAACATSPDEANQERAEIQKMEQDTLARLYSLEPSAQRVVKDAAGYAVFSNFGMKIMVAGTGSGKGVAVDNKTGERTYMRMGEVQAGLGMGAKKFQVVFAFQDPAKLSAFINQGWEFGAQTTAAATTAETGGAMQGAIAVAPGVWMYQLTETGVALEATVKGTKYWKDEDLNKS
jgi:lipid-binding SYLF domain-containing protein